MTDPSNAPAKRRPRSGWTRIALALSGLLALVLLVVAGSGAGLWWATGTPSGTAWLLSQVDGVTVTAPRGSLLGDFEAERIEVVLPAARPATGPGASSAASGAGNAAGGAPAVLADGRVVLSGVGWRGLQLRFGPRGPQGGWLRVVLADLHATRVDLVLPADDPARAKTPLQLPETLRLPVEVDLARLRIGELHAAALGEQPLRDVSARLHVGADGGSQHRVDALSIGWDRLQADGAARIGADAPFALDVQVALLQHRAPVGSAAAAGITGPSPSPSPSNGSASAAAAAASASAPAATPARPAATAPAQPLAPAAAGEAAWRAALNLSGALEQPTLTASVQLAAASRAASGPAGGTSSATVPPAPQTLDARAVLRPFAAWPLAELVARTNGFDLSALVAAAPATALTGRADLRTLGLDQPAILSAQFDNARAGRWNEGRLPLRRLAVELRGRPDDRRVLDLQVFDADLGTAAQSAGRLHGSGRWTQERSALDLQLAAVQPALLDARAAPMRLSGSLSVTASGIDTAAPERAVVALRADLSGPLAGLLDAASRPAVSRAAAPSGSAAVDPARRTTRTATSRKSASESASAARPASAKQAPSKAPTPADASRTAAAAPSGPQPADRPAARTAKSAAPVVGAKPAALAGRDARLRLDATASLLKIDVREAIATVGAARASASGSASRAAVDAAWQLRGKASLVDFDPRPWWPGTDGSAWRRGPHRVNANGEVDLTLPAAGRPAAAASTTAATGAAPDRRAASTGPAAPAAGDNPPAWVAPTGSATLNVDRGSLLAGVPVALRATLRNAAGTPAQATLAADVAGNRIDAAAQLTLSTAPKPAAGAAGGADRVELTLAAPDLSRLSPLWRLALPAAAGAAGNVLAGTLNGNASLRGRWPDVTSSGRLDGSGLAVTLADAAGAAGPAERVAVRGLQARWQLGTAADAAVDVQAALQGVSWSGAAGAAGPSAETAELRLQGTAASHALSVNVGSRALPPAWVDALQAANTAAGGRPAAAASTTGAIVAAPVSSSGTASRPPGTLVVLQMQGGLTRAGDAGAAGGAGPRGSAGRPRGADGATGTRPAGAASRAAAVAPGAVTAGRSGAVEPATASGGTPRAGSAAVARATPPAGTDGSRAWSASGWRGTLQRAELRSSDAGKPAWLQARDIGLAVQWAGGPASVAVQPGRLDILGAALRFGRIDWQAAVAGVSPARLNAQANLDPLPVAPLLDRVQPDFGWGGDLRVGARLDVKTLTTPAGTPAFSADVVVERAGGDLTVTDEFGTQPLGLTDLRIGLNAQNGVWSFTQGLAGKALGVAAGAIVARTSPAAVWPAADTPIEGVLELQVANLATWGTWVPTGWRLGGELRTSASIGGRFGAPEYTGAVRGSGLWVRNFLQGVNVNDGELAITLAGNTARIDRFTAKGGSGTVTLAGDATLGAAPRATLRLSADHFQLLGRVDRRVVASGDTRLTLDRDAIALDGKLTVDEGLVDFSRGDAPSLSDDVVVLRRPAAASAAQAKAAGAGAATLPVANARLPSNRPAAAAPARATGPNTAPSSAPTGAPAAAAGSPAGSNRTLALNLQVDLGQQLRLKGRGLDSGLRGELRITSPNNRLAVNGTVSTFGGNYAAYGQKLAIDRGAITFSGIVDNPRLDIEATRPDIDTRVGVRVGGTALNPRVRLFSEPDMADIDKLSWLVLGRASDGTGGADAALLQRAAMALFAGESEGTASQWTKAIGLDDISLKQTDGEVRSTVITLGKQISQRWYVGYERGLNATAGSWQLIYRVARRFTLRAQTGDDNSLDVIWSWRWQ